MPLIRRTHSFYRLPVHELAGKIAPKSVQAIITSPPYYPNLRNYGLKPQIWDGRADCEHAWGEVIPGRMARWGNPETLSEKQRSNKGCAGNLDEPTDCGRNCSKCHAWEGHLGCEPAHSDYIRHLTRTFKTLCSAVLKPNGLLFVNIGDSYCRLDEKYHKPKDLYGTPWTFAEWMREAGFYVRNAIIWHKPNVMPRSVQDSFTPSYELLFMFAIESDYYFDQHAVKEPAKTGNGMRNKRDVWTIPTAGRSEHPAAFPEELVEPCILAATRRGDTILDPFAGSGTVSAVGKRLGRKTIYNDLNAGSMEQARRRIGVL